jgi:hypothetical protein
MNEKTIANLSYNEKFAENITKKRAFASFFQSTSMQDSLRSISKPAVYILSLFCAFAVVIPGILMAAETYAPEFEAELLDVHIDNRYIQSHRGRLGRWVRSGSEPLPILAHNYGVSTEEIREINDQFAGVRSMIFVPMGLEKYNGLLNEGKGRRVVKLDPRRLLWPVENPAYSSRYGVRRGGNHNGLDLACAPNTIVLAANDGVVTHSGWFGALGQAVAIRHPDGIVTWYGHNTSVFLKIGEEVRRGQAVAFSGNTGRSTGPHVHFEVRYENIAMNPEDFLEAGLIQPGVVFRESTPMDFSNLEHESAMFDETGRLTDAPIEN